MNIIKLFWWIIQPFFSFMINYFSYINDKIKYGGKVGVVFGSKLGNCQFEGANAIGEHCRFEGSMGYGSYISDNCRLECVSIGRFSSIAPNVQCGLGLHPITYPYVATCPMFYSLNTAIGKTFAKKQMFNEFSKQIIIGNDCWIGQNVFICGGVSIGDGAVVYAGSVVTKDVEPYSVVGGIPASIIKYRYDESTIQLLLKLKWWNQPIEWLEKNWLKLNNIDELISHLSNQNISE